MTTAERRSVVGKTQGSHSAPEDMGQGPPPGDPAPPPPSQGVWASVQS